MKVLVTGGCGFLGSHICERYIKKGWEVIAYDNLTKYELQRTGFNVLKARDHNVDFLLKLGVRVLVNDIRDMKDLYQATSNCDYIIHTAAQPAMTIAIENPLIDFQTNVEGMLNVLECARLRKIPVAICSTIHVYGNGINDHLFEDEDGFQLTDASGSEINEEREILTGEITPLHASKRTSEIYAQAFSDTYGMDIAVFRLTGMYGPRQFGGEDHGWVANFAIRTMLKRPITIFGTNKQVRDILYIKDAVKAFEMWYDTGRIGGIYNIGGGIKTVESLKTCLMKLKLITDKQQDITIKPGREGDLYYFVCNTKKAFKTFLWKATTTVEEGLTRLTHWIKENISIFQGEK